MLDGPYPVFGSTSIIGWHEEFKIQGPGVVTGRSGSLGVVQYVEKDYWPHNTALWVKDFKGNLPRYVYYFLQTLGLEKYNAGVGVPTLNRNHLDNLEIDVHEKENQCKIASILSAYDDLIENNTRRIKILEEMAQAIYREWFVEFRAPGVELRPATREEQKLTGKDVFPKGWEVKTFGEVALNFDSKRKPISSMKRAEMKGEYPYYGAAKVLDYVNDFIFDGKYLLIAEDGSVITPDRKPVLQLVNCKFWPNNHTHVIQGKGLVSTEFLYLMLTGFEISGYITGAAQPKITQANLNRIPVIVPDEATHVNFNEMARNHIDLIHKLERKSGNLRRTRDLLLPKLMSGELRLNKNSNAFV